MFSESGGIDGPVSLSLYLDDALEPFATYRPPATVDIDTTTLTDGPHILRVVARDALGNPGLRTIPFIVQNGPGITVHGLRANELVRGTLQLDVNAFQANAPFDPVQAESSGPIPVWTWVMFSLFAAWAAWYGMTEFSPPAVLASANAPMTQRAPTPVTGHGATAGFDYAATGPKLYTANCSACHGATGSGVPGAFPALVADPAVLANDPKEHITVVLHGLQGKAILGKPYTSQMPAFNQLSDEEIAAIIDHERTSWGNTAPTITPNDVKRLR